MRTNIKRNVGTLLLVYLGSIWLTVAQANSGPDKAPTEVNAFAQYMHKKHGFTEDYVKMILGQVEVRQAILDAMSRPAESKDWYQYRPIFIEQKRIKQGVQFWLENEETLRRAEEKYQVPAEIIVAIIGVETRYGRVMGNFPVIDAIATLAFHYPKRGAFFAGELEQYFVLAREQGWDLQKPKGSYAGAMGMGQFIPTSYRHYAVDFDGDGKVNLFDNVADAIGSVANYFHVHGWRMGEPVAEYLPMPDANLVKQFGNKSLKPQFTLGAMKQAGLEYQGPLADKDIAGIYTFKQATKEDYWLGFHNFYVITRYNRSPLYAMAVHQLSLEIKDAVEHVKQTSVEAEQVK